MRIASRHVLFPGCTDPLPAAARLASRRPPVELLEYAASDGIRLRGAWVRSGKPEPPTVLYFHGNAESASGNLPLGAELARAGFDVVLAEYRGYGGLDGSPSEAGVVLDGEAALGAIQARGVPLERVILVGRSLGTGVAVELARGRQVKLVVLVSPFTAVVDLARRTVGPLAPLVMRDAFDSASKIAELDAPVVVIHGTVDTLIPFAHGTRLACRRGEEVRRSLAQLRISLHRSWRRLSGGRMNTSRGCGFLIHFRRRSNTQSPFAGGTKR
jgi:fermentation-respiration switch protein FrsA (DUF1100 family)